MKIFYFTGTGNSLYIAKRLGGELISIPQVLNGEVSVYEDEKIGIIFPTYGLSVPAIVLDFFGKVKLRSPYIFVIMTCGNNSGDATKWIASYVKRYGIKISYSNCIAMVGNHIPIADIEKEKSLNKHIEESISDLVEDLKIERCYIRKGTALGPILRNGAKIIKKVTSMDKPINFSVNEHCIKCGTCIKVCPRNNVSYNEVSEIMFGDTCESCLSCVNNCPKKAIQVKGDKNPNARFRNSNVSLKEIIDSNHIIKEELGR